MVTWRKKKKKFRKKKVSECPPPPPPPPPPPWSAFSALARLSETIRAGSGICINFAKLLAKFLGLTLLVYLNIIIQNIMATMWGIQNNMILQWSLPTDLCMYDYSCVEMSGSCMCVCLETLIALPRWWGGGGGGRTNCKEAVPNYIWTWNETFLMKTWIYETCP